MKTATSLIVALCAFAFASCSTVNAPGSVSTSQQTIANAVEDALSIGLVPVLSKNPSYIGAAQTIAAGLGSFSGTTITADDVASFLSKVPDLTPADAKVIAGVVNSAWAVYQKRYAQQVGATVRPDVKLFLQAVSDGILAACAAVPKS